MKNETITKIKLVRKLDNIYTAILTLICATSLVMSVFFASKITNWINTNSSVLKDIVLPIVYSIVCALFIIGCLALFNKIVSKVLYAINKNKLGLSYEEFILAIQNNFYNINGFFITTSFSIEEAKENNKYVLSLRTKSFEISKDNYDIIKKSNNKILCIDLEEYKKDSNPNFELV